MTTFKDIGIVLKKLVEKLNIFGKIGKYLGKVHRIEKKQWLSGKIQEERFLAIWTLTSLRFLSFKGQLVVSYRGVSYKTELRVITCPNS